jgi:hypothetical protein
MIDGTHFAFVFPFGEAGYPNGTHFTFVFPFGEAGYPNGTHFAFEFPFEGGPLPKPHSFHFCVPFRHYGEVLWLLITLRYHKKSETASSRRFAFFVISLVVGRKSHRLPSARRALPWCRSLSSDFRRQRFRLEHLYGRAFRQRRLLRRRL